MGSTLEILTLSMIKRNITFGLNKLKYLTFLVVLSTASVLAACGGAAADHQANVESGASGDASARTNADLLREVGNLAGLNLTQFGLPSQNRGSVL